MMVNPQVQAQVLSSNYDVLSQQLSSL